MNKDIISLVFFLFSLILDLMNFILYGNNLFLNNICFPIRKNQRNLQYFCLIRFKFLHISLTSFVLTLHSHLQVSCLIISNVHKKLFSHMMLPIRFIYVLIFFSIFLVVSKKLRNGVKHNFILIFTKIF